jgi:hypothetical protein
VPAARRNSRARLAHGVRLASAYPFDEPPFRAFDRFDLEAFSREVVERLACQVVGRKVQRERFEQVLDEPDCEQRASHVLEEQDASAWAKHASCFRDGPARVGDGAEGERADDRVEGPVVEVERLGIAEPQIGVPSELARPPPPDCEHLLAELDPGEDDLGGVVANISRRSDGDLEHATASSPADPLTAALDEHAFDEGDAPVVAVRLAVLQTAHSLRLLRDAARSPHRHEG